MRRAVVSVSLVAMLAAVVGFGLTREAPTLASADDPSAAPTQTPAPAAEADDPESTTPPPADPAIVEPTSLKIVGASWEVLAPGVFANGGMTQSEDSAFAKVGVTAQFFAGVDTADLETRLGLGGDVKGGADIALMPLPDFVASYERLRALSPEVFFVIAWSRGRDALTGNVSLVGAAPKKGPIALHGAPGSAHTLLGLFALDVAGVDASRVDVSDAPGPSGKRSMQALRRRKSRQLDARDVVLSTADATRLIPIVAIAPKRVLEDKRAAIAQWAGVWLEGTRALEAEPAIAARLLSSQSGAPRAVDLIDALGWVEFATLSEAAAATGLSGRRAATLDELFARTWRLWRRSGLIATPPPQRLPLNAVVIAKLAGNSELALHSPTSRAPESSRPGTAPIVVHRIVGKATSPAVQARLAEELAFLADVFPRSTLRVTVSRNPDVAADVVQRVVRRFGYDSARLVAVSKRVSVRGGAAQIDVMPAR